MTLRSLPPVVTPARIDGLMAATRAVCGTLPEDLDQVLLRRFGGAVACLLDSGTSALAVALSALSPSHLPVAIPAFGCYDLITALQMAKRQAITYDLDTHTLSPDLASVDAALSRGCAALVVASVFGYPPRMSEILELTRPRAIPLVEDIAQAGGARWLGRPLGQWGEATVLSFGRGKGLGGAGGGAVLFREHLSPGLDTKARPSRDIKGFLALTVQQVLASPRLYWLPDSIPWLALGETIYHRPWTPFSIGRAQAALAGEAITHIDEDRQRRATVSGSLTEALQPFRESIQLIEVPQESTPGFLRLGGRMTRAQPSLRRWGIRRSYPIPLPEHPELKPLLALTSNHPGAQRLCRELVSLPTHSGVSDEDVLRLVEHLRGLGSGAA